MESNLTAFFEGPFRGGVLERVGEGMLSACKVTFGAEPGDCEVRESVPRHEDADRIHSLALEGSQFIIAAVKRRRAAGSRSCFRKDVGSR